MKTQQGFERYLTYINCEIQPPGKSKCSQDRRFRAITISRQAGSGGHTLAEMLATRLQDSDPDASPPWTVFDRNLVDKVLEEHNLPARMARFMPEDSISDITDAMDELFGLHPNSWELVRKVAETILHLAQQGNVVIIGRGANLITAPLDNVLHVRLVGSLENRLKRLMESESLSRRAALDLLHRQDRARARYVSKNFEEDINNALLYHMIINTDLTGCEEAVSIILGMMQLPHIQMADKRPRDQGVAIL